jgi:hypothetical protein
MKYKVGDKVRIREDLIASKRYNGLSFVPSMEQYKGKVATITNIIFGYYCIDLDNESWHLVDEMFEDIIKSENKDEEKTVDIGYYLVYCGHRIIKNVYYGGYAHDHDHVFCTTADNKNQYTLPIESIDFVVPHMERCIMKEEG